MEMVPNFTARIQTRALAAQAAEYEQQRQNDEAIREVLAHFDGEEDTLDMLAPESMHTVDSLETCSINLWESVFRDNVWRTAAPITKVAGFGATHPGGGVDVTRVVGVGNFQDRYHGAYAEWSEGRAGWAVLVPNRFLSESSFHTGDTPSWTQGDVIGEGLSLLTGKKMVLCDLGGFRSEIHMEAENVRIADGPDVRACGSEGGHGYGWWRRQHCFSPRTPIVFPENVDSYPGSAGVHLNGMAGGTVGGTEASGGQSEDGPGRTEHVAENAAGVRTAQPPTEPAQPPGSPIADYDAPSDIEGADGTQDSTARMTFPKVSIGLPEYLQHKQKVKNAAGKIIEKVVGSDVFPDSSDKEWLPEFEDTIESSESDFQVNGPDEAEPLEPGLEDWCMREESWAPVRLEPPELAHHYRKQSWNSASVGFVGSRDNFTGPIPGLKCGRPEGVPRPETVFELYWSDATVDRIVLETNRYARTFLPPRGDNPARTKGGSDWEDVDRNEIKGWLGICILMGCKRLPSIRQYWMRSQPFLYCDLISSVMTLERWQRILRCLHLVHNSTLIRDVANVNFDRIAKTRWLVEMFVQVSKDIYNLEREITVDECVIPYKGKYCYIRQFMPDKPVRFGIKVWLLASSKSRFVTGMEVYFGEGTGAGPHGLGYHVVERMMKGLEHRGHCLVIDNFFGSVNLFHELMCQGIWATGTVRKTSKNLPGGLYRDTDPTVRGSMLIRNHVHRQMGVVSWQDKKMVTLLSTAAAPWEPNTQVLRRIPGMRGQLIVPSSPMHRQYVEYMRGVDVTDQLRGNYSSQLRCHKWWMKIFHLIVDQSMVNSYVTWVKDMQDMGMPVMSHLAFKISVGRHLLQGAIEDRRRRQRPSPPTPRRPPRLHVHFRSNLRRRCVVCGRIQKWYCPACGSKWMCPEECYLAHHQKN